MMLDQVRISYEGYHMSFLRQRSRVEVRHAEANFLVKVKFSL